LQNFRELMALLLPLCQAVIFFFLIPTVPGQSSVAKPEPLPAVAFAEITRQFNFPTITRALPPRVPYRIAKSDYSVERSKSTLLPAMGGCIAIGDYDGDGRPDLYIVLPGIPNHLFHNDGNGKFSDVTESAGVAGDGTGLSATFADYDHSGHLSLLVAGLGGVQVFRRNGDGTFKNVSERAGLKTAPAEIDTSVLVFDSGLGSGSGPDVLVTGYADLSAPPSKASYLLPNDFPGVISHLFRNQGNGTFADITASSGLDGNPGRARKALVADFNGDGRMDILLLRENKPPVLYLNLGQGRFKDATTAAGEDIWPYAFFDGQVADFNHDGKPDVALWSTIAYRALLNKGEARFADEKAPLIRPPAGLFEVPGTVFDIRQDGYDDLLGIDADYKVDAVMNHGGQLAKSLSPVAIQGVAANPPWGENKFVAIVQGYLRGKNEVDLVGLRADGGLVIYTSVPGGRTP
jgi:hypothetical protein